MESNLELFFQAENKTIQLDIQQPDLAGLIHKIVAEHLVVSRENIEIRSDNEHFDKNEFLELLVDVHEDFSEEIDLFYENIEKEISTYYNDEQLSEHIINTIKDLYAEEVRD